VGPPPIYHCIIERLDFSNETVLDIGDLSRKRSSLAAVSSSSYGYFGGGNIPPFSERVDRIDFSNDTTSLPGNNLPEARWGLAAVSSSSYGYFAGGQAPPFVCTIDRLDFSNETISTPFGAGNGLPVASREKAAVSN